MSHGGQHVCRMEHAGMLDSGIRSLFHNPYKILTPLVRSGFTVLDLGCGPGFFTVPLAEMVGPSGRVIAADLQEGMLDMLRRKLKGTELEKRVELHKTGKDRIGINDRIDFALIFYMLHELPEPLKALTEIRHMLNPQGNIFIVEPYFHVSKRVFESSMNNLEAVGFQVLGRPKVFFSRAAILAG